ncbi:MAG: Gfo/Idh/MocA family oxidoreductase [Caldilineaceae bacterium]
MNNKPLRVAFLGAGMIADYHRKGVEACADQNVELAAIGHYNPAKFSDISNRHHLPCFDYAQIFADPEIDVVAICTPSGSHAAEAIAALNAGKHVLVEKPMALNLVDADAMIEAAKRNGVVLAVALQRRTETAYARAHQAIMAGDLGEMTQAAITIPYVRTKAYYGQAAWRGTWAADGGGVLMNQGIHLVDQLVWNMGDPVEVKAHAATLRHAIEVEDTLSASLRFANGALGTITATTTAAPGFPHTLSFYGSNGGIQIEGDNIRYWTLADASKATIEPIQPASTVAGAGAGGDPRGIAATGHIAIWKDFIEAIRTGKQPMLDGAEGRRSLAAVLAVYEAAGITRQW